MIKKIVQRIIKWIMANYEALKTAIRNTVYENGNNEITGQGVQDVLIAIVNALGAGYQFTGVATPETEPGTPDVNVMYIAGAGTYPNFDATKVPQGSLGVFRYNGSWDYSVLDIASWADASNKFYYNTQAGNVAAKTIQADGFTLQPGGWIKIHFNNANEAENPTLNVNNTGAHAMTFNGALVSESNSWKTGETVAFYYDNFGVGIWHGIRLVELPDFVNVNDLVGQSTPFASASAARTAIPQQNRKAGLNIAYLLSTGENTSQWQLDMFIGDDVTDWGVADNWTILGPVAIAPNIQYGGFDLSIGPNKHNIPDQSVTPKSKKVAGVDLSIEDDNFNILSLFKNGHFRTKKFDSSQVGKCVDGSDCDLDIEDIDNNELAQFFGGHFRTRNFNSKRLPGLFRNYQGKIISVLGDSISTFGTPDSRNEDGTYCYSYYPIQTCRYSQNGTVVIEGVTYDSIQFDVKDTWWYKVIKQLGGKLGINDSWRGMSISNIRGDDGSLSNQNRINHLKEHGIPDLILVYGGTNDAGAGATLGTFDTTPPPTTAEGIAALGNTTFADGVRTMLVRLMFTYPNAEIVVILPTLTTSYYTIENLDLYVEILKEVCDYFGIRYIDIRTAGINFYNKQQYFVDGIHPNVAGMELLYKCIYNNLIFN